MVGRIALLLFVLAVIADGVLLWNKKQAIFAQRVMADRFSNGDNNEVRVRVENNYRFPIDVEVIDEIPVVFQRRDVCFKAHILSEEAKTIKYVLRPTQRGVYDFGLIRVFVASPLSLLQRRFSCGEEKDVKVYPSFLMLHQYEL